MRIIDSHFHWWPRSVWDALCKRKGYPRAEADGKGGYRYFPTPGKENSSLGPWPAWFDLDEQFEHMDNLGHYIEAFGSIGPFSVHFSYLPKTEGKGSRDPLERRDGRRDEVASGPLLGQCSGAARRHRDRARKCSRMPSDASV